MSSSIVSLTLLVSAVSASLYPGQSNLNHTCAITNSNKVLSCSEQANPTTSDSCCVETYGGLFLSTQFWSTYTGLESSGQLLPSNSWTLHGLWPDFCNGSYTQYCDLSRQYDPTPSPNTTNGQANGTRVPPYKGPNIGTFLEPFGRYDLLSWMNKYWINQGAPNSDFWGHEFSKHATCYSTFDVPCYGPQYREHEDVVEFFDTAISYYRQLPTFDWLAEAGITPSNATTYSLSDIQGALADKYGAVPYVGCSGPKYNETKTGYGTGDNGRIFISEAWYYFHAFGRPQDGKWVPVDAAGSSSNCAKTPRVVHYPERSNGSVRANTPAP